MGPALYHWALMARMPLRCCCGFRTPDPTPAAETKFSWSLCVDSTPRPRQEHPNAEPRSQAWIFSAGYGERGVCPFYSGGRQGSVASTPTGKSKCWGVKNDRFPLTFAITNIRTILYIIDQNKLHMDSEWKCKT